MTFSNYLILGIRMLRRDWRSGELTILAIGLIVSVSCVSLVGALTERIKGGVIQESTELLAADIVIKSSDPISNDLINEVGKYDLRFSQIASFRSVIVKDDTFQLVEVKAVDSNYPLRGALKISEKSWSDDIYQANAPEDGNSYIGPRLLALLGLKLGDSIDLGESKFTISAVISTEPDRGSEVFNLAPRVMIPYENLAQTGLLAQGSRAKYKLLVAGERNNLERFKSSIAADLRPNQRIIDISEGRPAIQTALERIDRFLQLASLVAVIVAGLAIAITANRHASKQYDYAALLGTLGTNSLQILTIFVVQLMIIGVVASLVGCAIGYGISLILGGWFEDLFKITLPVSTTLPFLKALMIGMIALILFTLPPLMRLAKVPPMRILRRDLEPQPFNQLVVFSLQVLILSASVLLISRDITLSLYIIGGSLLTIIVLILCTRIATYLVSTILPRLKSSLWRLGLGNWARYPAITQLQVLGFGLGMMVILLLTVVRSDIVDQWRNRLPEGTPNYFLVNIQPHEQEAIENFIETNTGESISLFPMIRGRLEAVNGKPVNPENFNNPRDARLVTREFNLSHAASLRNDNVTFSGQLWSETPPYPKQWSVEKGITEVLGVTIGDKLQFHIAGQSVEAEISHIREVAWDSFKVNFFVVAAPGLLEEFPTQYIGSFYLPPKQRNSLVDLVRKFPSTTIIDVEAALNAVRKISRDAITAIEVVFAFTLFAGLCVLAAAFRATEDRRRKDTAVLRTLGMSQTQVFQSLFIELSSLGILAGVISASGAGLLGYYVAQQLLGLDYHPTPLLWVVGAFSGMSLMLTVGFISTYRALKQSPMLTLRNSI